MYKYMFSFFIRNKLIDRKLIRIANKTVVSNLHKYHQTIINTDLPICKKCLYFEPSSSKCLKFGEMNLLTGVIEYSSAETNRSSVPCGKKGLHFTKKTIHHDTLLEDFWYP